MKALEFKKEKRAERKEKVGKRAKRRGRGGRETVGTRAGTLALEPALPTALVTIQTPLNASLYLCPEESQPDVCSLEGLTH